MDGEKSAVEVTSGSEMYYSAREVLDPQNGATNVRQLIASHYSYIQWSKNGMQTPNLETFILLVQFLLANKLDECHI